MRYCIDGGALVGATGWLPPAPFDHYWGNQGPVAGCNHVVCQRCGETVQSWPGFTKARGGDPDPNDILDAGDPSTVAGVSQSASGRLYVCRCHAFANHADQPIRTPLVHLDVVPRDWACGGHPIEVPTVLDGVDTDDLETAVATALAGAQAWPWAHPKRAKWPGLWLARLAVIRPDKAEAIGQIVARALDSSDPVVLRTALGFCFQHPESAAAARLPALVRDARDRFTPTDPYEPRRTLDWALIWAFEVRLVRVPDAEAVDVCRALVLGGDRKRLFHLSRVDAPWLGEHILDVVAGGIGADWVLTALQKHPDQAAAAVSRLRTNLDTASLEALVRDALPGSLGEAALAGTGAPTPD
jgi:hypothetical protein